MDSVKDFLKRGPVGEERSDEFLHTGSPGGRAGADGSTKSSSSSGIISSIESLLQFAWGKDSGSSSFSCW